MSCQDETESFAGGEEVRKGVLEVDSKRQQIFFLPRHALKSKLSYLGNITADGCA